MELTDAVRSRRSIRTYRPQPVPDDVIGSLIDLARTFGTTGALRDDSGSHAPAPHLA